ncbi:MAG: hypothetical protein PUH04_07845 [Firmicutes bacterium]|nr:hypothetical protein [Blautia sp.]MDD7371525.1 hypothetical protein [Bacillota bacterium]
MEGFADSRKKNRQKQNWIRLAEQGCIPTEGGTYTNPASSMMGETGKTETPVTAFHIEKIGKK